MSRSYSYTYRKFPGPSDVLCVVLFMFCVTLFFSTPPNPLTWEAAKEEFTKKWPDSHIFSEIELAQYHEETLNDAKAYILKPGLQLIPSVRLRELEEAEQKLKELQKPQAEKEEGNPLP